MRDQQWTKTETEELRMDLTEVQDEFKGCKILKGKKKDGKKLRAAATNVKGES